MFVRTLRPEPATFGTLYAPATSPAMPEPKPAPYAPTSSVWSAVIARMWPSSSSAIVTVADSSRGCGAATRFSQRSSIHFSGAPSAIAAMATAVSSRPTLIFSPKPPPTSWVTTRTRFVGSASIAAKWSRAAWAPWLDNHTDISPEDGSKLATTPRVSIGTARYRCW